MSEVSTVQPFKEGFVAALCPELIIFAGLLLLIIVPNLGKGTVRIPGTQTRVIWFLGGERFKLTLSKNPLVDCFHFVDCSVCSNFIILPRWS